MSDQLNLAILGKMSDADARKLLEQLRWPDGPICPHCGVVGEATAMASHDDTAADARLREGVYNCRACRKPFSVTVNTIFEGSHIGLAKWLLGFYLFATSKKSLSALQLQRHLGLGSYRTAWHMAHRIRAAFQNDGPLAPLTGIIELDETYVGGKPRRHAGEAPGRKRPAYVPPRRRGRGARNKTPVQVLVQRDGAARARVVADCSAGTLKPYIREHVARTAALHSDEWNGYTGLGAEFEGGHHIVRHSKGEYARGAVHSNSAESFNGLFKRAIVGAWHNISREHMDRYLSETAFRWSHREEPDTARTLRALRQAAGVRLYYREPKVGEGSGEGLVAGR